MVEQRWLEVLIIIQEEKGFLQVDDISLVFKIRQSLGIRGSEITDLPIDISIHGEIRSQADSEISQLFNKRLSLSRTS